MTRRGFQYWLTSLALWASLGFTPATQAAYNGPGYYQIIHTPSDASKNCLGRDKYIADNRGHIQLRWCNEGGQAIYVMPVSFTSETNQAITISGVNLILRNSGKCFDTELNSLSFIPILNDPRVIQYQCEFKRESQVWQIEARNGGYQIRNVAANQCLSNRGAVAVSFGFPVAADEISLDTCSGTAAQIFSVMPAAPASVTVASVENNTDINRIARETSLSNRTFRLISAKTNQCLDEGGTFDVASAVFETACSNSNTQEWKLTNRPADKGYEGYGYWIKSAFYEPVCLDALGGSTAPGSRISIIECFPDSNGTIQENNQIWYAVPVGIDFFNTPYKIDGSRNVGNHFNDFPIRVGEKFLIINKYSNLCMQTDNTGKAIQATCDASDAQFWYLREVINSGEAKKIGQWSGKIKLPSMPVAAALLPNGKVLSWSSWDRLDWTQAGRGQTTYPGGGNTAPNKTYTSFYDPTTHSVTDILPNATQHDMFCPGTAYLADGRLHVAGGGYNVKNTSIFNFTDSSWTADDLMNQGRWYNTSVTMPNGDVFTLGGSHFGRAYNTFNDGHGEIWRASRPSGSRWQDLPAMKMDPLLIGTTSEKYLTNPTDTDVPQTDANRAEEHPKLVVAPNGKLFAAGPTPFMQWYDVSSNAITPAGRRGGDEVSQNSVVVMYSKGKLLKAGGNTSYDGGKSASDGNINCIQLGGACATFNDLDLPLKNPSNANAYLIDINNGSKVTPIPKMRFNRTFANGVVLPDGSVLILGGSGNGKPYDDSEPRIIPELFNPATKTWRNMAPMPVVRGYHSVALLLPDGRVFTGGGGLCGTCNTNHPDGELFSPPYLFKGARPVINSAPTTISYGTRFNVTTGGATATRFTLIRLSSVTHSVNTDQRLIELEAGLNGSTYVISSPENANVAPPGYYMLFALDANNIPSIAKIIKLN